MYEVRQTRGMIAHHIPSELEKYSPSARVASYDVELEKLPDFFHDTMNLVNARSMTASRLLRSSSTTS